MNKLENPYVGPRTFEEKERGRFFGRERESRELLALVISEQLVLFYAQSGAGKSSLINTSLIPDLRRRGFKTFPVVRVGGDAPSGLKVDNIYVFNLLRKMASQDVDIPSLASISLCQFLAAQKNEPLVQYAHDEEPEYERRVLIIDQFEELFSTHHEDWEKRKDFFSQLTQAMQEDPYLWVVLVMREDFIAALEPYEYMLPGRLRSRYYMERLGREAALKAIRSPAENSLPYASGAAEKLVDDLCSIKVQKPDGSLDIQPGQYVEPVQLQVVCFNLWENLNWDHIFEKEAQITVEEVKSVGDVNTSLGNYYAKRIEEVSQSQGIPERKIRRWIEEKLIAPGGIRNMVLQEKNSSAGGLEDSVIQALQSDLIRAEARGGAMFYELTHDRLVEPIIENNRMWLDKYSSLLQKLAAGWANDPQHSETWLSTDQKLVEVEEWALNHPDELTKDETDYLQACRERQLKKEHEIQMQEEREEQERERLRQNEEQEKRLRQQELEAARALAEAQAQIAQEQTRSAQKAQRLSRIAVALAGVALVALIFAGWGTWQAGQSAKEAEKRRWMAETAQAVAEEAKANAESLSNAALSGRLANLAMSGISQIDLSALLSIEAYNIKQENPATQSALMTSYLDTSRLRGLLPNSANPAQDVYFSPDNLTIATQERDGVRLWDLSTRLPLGFLRASPVETVVFSPDSKRIALLIRDGIQLWNIADRNHSIRVGNSPTVNQHQGQVSQLETNADSSRLLSVGEDGTVILWNLQTGKRVAVDIPTVESVVVDPSGNLFITIGNGIIQLRDFYTGAEIGSPTAGTEATFSPDSPDGQFLAVQDKQDNLTYITLWNITEVPAKTIGDIFQGSNVVFSPNGKYLVSRNQDQTLTLRISSSGDVVRSGLQGEKFTFSPMSTFFIALRSQAFSIWKLEMETATSRGEYSITQTEVPVFDEDEEHLYYFSNNNTISVLNLSETTPTVFNDPKNPINGGTLRGISQDGEILVIAQFDGKTTLRTSVDAKLVDTFEGEFQGFSADDKFLIALDKGKVVLWDRAKEEETETEWIGNNILFSDNRDFLAVFSNRNTNKLWNLRKDSGEASPFQVASGSTSTALFSRDGTKLIVGGTDGSIFLLETANGEIMNTLDTGYRGKITGLNFSPDGKILISSTAHSVNLMDVETGKKIERKFQGTFAGMDSQHGILALVNGNGKITLRDISGNSQIGSRFEGERVIFSPDGKTLAVINGNTISLRDVMGTNESQAPIVGEFYNFSPDGKKFAVLVPTYPTGKRFSIRSVFNLFEVSSIGVGNVMFSPNSQTLIYTPQGGNNAVLRNLTSGSEINLGNNISKYIFSHDGKTLVVGKSDGSLNFWNVEKAKPITDPISGHPQPIENLRLSRDGEMLASIGTDGSVLLWNMVDQDAMGDLIYEPSNTISSSAFSPDGKTMAIYTDNGIVLRSVESGNIIGGPFNAHTLHIASVQFSPDGKILAATSADGRLILYDLRNGKTITKLWKATLYAFSPNSNSILIKPRDTDLTLINTQSGQVSANFPSENDSATYSPDGDVILIPTKVAGFKIFDISKDAEIDKQIEGNSPVFSPKGKWLITRQGEDVIIWDTRTWTEHATITTLGGSYPQFSPDGTRLLYITDKGTILWDIETRASIGKVMPGASYSFGVDGRYIYRYEGTIYPQDLTVREARTTDVIIKPMKGYIVKEGDEEIPFLLFNHRIAGYSLWDVKKNTWVKKELLTKADSVYPGSRYLITFISQTRKFTLWDMATAEEIGDLPESPSYDGWGFSENGKYFISYFRSTETGPCLAKAINIWDPATQQDKVTIGSNTIEDNRICIAPKNKFAVVRSADGIIEGWDLNSRSSTGIIKDFHMEKNDVMAFSGEGNTLAIYGKYGIRIFNLQDMEEIKGSFKEASGIVTSLTFSADGKYLASLGKDGVNIWTIEDHPKRINPEIINAKDGNITSISFLEDGNNDQLIFLSDDRTIFKSTLAGDVTEFGNPIPRRTLICASAISPNGKLLAYQKGKQLFIHRIGEAYDEDHPIETKNSCSGTLAFGPDNQTLAYSDLTKITLINTESGDQAEINATEVFHHFVGLKFIEYDDTRKIIAAQNDRGYISLWNIDEQSRIGEPFIGDFQGLDAEVAFPYHDSEGRLIVLDFSSLRTSLDTWRDALCAKIARNFTEEEYHQYIPGLDFEKYQGTCLPSQTPARP